MTTHVEPQHTPIFSTYARDWLRLHPVAERTKQDYRYLLEDRLIPVFGATPLNLITHREIQAWVNTAAQRSYSQTRQALSVMRQVFRLAEIEGHVPRSPIALVRLPKAAPAVPNPLSPEEFARLVEAMPTPRDALMTQVLGLGGLRFSELAALTVSSLQEDFLVVDSGIQPRRGGGLIRSDTKGHKQRRVYLPEATMTALRAYAQGLAEPTSVLFPTRAGTPVHRGNWAKRVLIPACARAGIKPITPHALRDTCATLALRQGTPPQVVAAQLGHTDASVTLRHYAGVLDGDQRKLAADLGFLFAESSQTNG
ncbi:tyrosine-type recombinase/integrase [Corynebacterium mastitidis]|uniref:Tyrosine-type recombinase/integrase n=1 Tax=Corynebacterium mastitidis TaxID=161890 RepID=A0ABU8NXM8_9CORY